MRNSFHDVDAAVTVTQSHMLCDWQPELTPSESIFRVRVFFFACSDIWMCCRDPRLPHTTGTRWGFYSFLFAHKQFSMVLDPEKKRRQKVQLTNLLVELKNPDGLKSINLFCLAPPLMSSTPPHPVDLMSFTCAQLTPPLSRSIKTHMPLRLQIPHPFVRTPRLSRVWCERNIYQTVLALLNRAKLPQITARLGFKPPFPFRCNICDKGAYPFNG